MAIARIDSKRSTLALIAGVVVLSFVWAFFGLETTSAISNIAPDPAEYGDAGSPNRIRLSLSNIPSTRKVTQIKVPIYVSAPENANPASIRADVQLYDFYLTYGGTYSSYRVWFNDGAGGGVGQCLQGNGVLEVGNFSWSPDYNLWVSTAYTILRDTSCTSTGTEAYNAKIDFRMRIQNYSYTVPGNPERTVTSNGQVPEAGGNSWIAYAVPDANDENSDSYFFSTDARERGGGFANYTLAFATPCNITTATRASIVLYDLDHNDGDNNGGDVSVSVRDLTDPTADLQLTRSGSMGDNGTYWLTMTFQPNHRYQLRVNNIYYWNVLQYRLPYDNIAYVVGCDGPISGELSPLLDIDPTRTTIADGQQFTARFRANSTASATVPVTTEARIWYDRNRNNQFDAGDDEAWHVRTTDGSPDITQANTTSILKQRGVTVDAGRGGVICVSWRLIATTRAGVTVQTNTLVECMRIAQSPFVQVWGNDLRVGGRYGGDTTTTSTALIRTSLMQANSGQYFGSWAEYGVLSPGMVDGMASGSGLANGSTSSNQTAWNRLTFANSSDLVCPSAGGCFTDDGANMGTLPDVAGAIDGGVFSHITPTCPTGGTINTTLVTSSRIIRCSGTVTIAGDITMAPGPFTSERAVPQLIILADTINIQSGVQRVDAWLVANQTINTCANGPANLTLNDCNRPLTVNGPTIARTLLLRRTAGAGAVSASSYAERFNLRADTYIWAYNQAQYNTTMRTTHIRELAPRY